MINLSKTPMEHEMERRNFSAEMDNADFITAFAATANISENEARQYWQDLDMTDSDKFGIEMMGEAGGIQEGKFYLASLI